MSSPRHQAAKRDMQSSLRGHHFLYSHRTIPLFPIMSTLLMSAHPANVGKEELSDEEAYYNKGAGENRAGRFKNCLCQNTSKFSYGTEYTRRVFELRITF